MMVIRLSDMERKQVIAALERATCDCLVAVDTIDEAFKVKVDHGTWSPPLGTVVKP
jgi:hypothetical protein